MKLMINKLLKSINNRIIEINSFRNSSVLYAFAINVICLIISLIAFEPTPKQDDYDQSMILYGGFTGKYSKYSQYTNFLFSRLVHLLMNIFPMISWYYVIQYLFIFTSFTTISFIFIKKGNRREWLIPVIAVLIFCSYELYIRFTFTKVAGICIIAGFLFLLYLIENQTNVSFKYLMGILLIFVGVIVRSSMYELIAEVFFSAFIIYIITGWKSEERKKYFFKIVLFIIIVVSIDFCNKGLDVLDCKVKSQDLDWENYIKNNGARVALQDYGIPDYEEHMKEYCDINVTENDYNAWKNEALYIDYDFFTPKLLMKIKQIEPRQKKVNIIHNIFKNMLSYYLNDTGIYLFFSAIIFLVVFEHQYLKLYLLPICGSCFVAYAYMCYLGRLQHHVDVMVLIAGAIILFYYCLPMQNIGKYDLRKCCLIFGMLIITFVMIEYEGLSYSSYYGSAYGSGKSQTEEYNKNREKLELLSDDTEHLYLIGAFSSDYIYNREWTMFDVVKPGYYHNMISSNLYYLPHVDEILSNYNIDNLCQEISNSDVIYAVSVDENPTFIDILCTYINEHYQKKTYYTKVKEVDNLNVYRFTSGDIEALWKEKTLKNSSNVISDVKITKTTDNEYVIGGYAYIDGEDSFAQNIYIGVMDKITGDSLYAYTLQTENDLFLEKNKYHGRYSKFSGTISKIDQFANIEISIYIETKDSVYYLKL